MGAALGRRGHAGTSRGPSGQGSSRPLSSPQIKVEEDFGFERARGPRLKLGFSGARLGTALPHLASPPLANSLPPAKPAPLPPWPLPTVPTGAHTLRLGLVHTFIGAIGRGPSLSSGALTVSSALQARALGVLGVAGHVGHVPSISEEHCGQEGAAETSRSPGPPERRASLSFHSDRETGPQER